MVARNYRTSKGTELPLLNLRGKQYLEVKFRLVWFREEHPDWSIETELMSVTEVSAYARATIRDETGRIIATSHKFENIKGFPDFIEKAETGSIGRALALIGYGTQFCADELDEGKRIVDAPTQIRERGTSNTVKNENSPYSDQEPSQRQNVEAQPIENDIEEDSDIESDEAMSEPGEYQITFGRKYKGRKLKDIPKGELESYLQWLESNALREGTSLSYQVKFLKGAFEKLYGANSPVIAAASSH